MVLSFSSVIVAALSIRFSMLFGSAWGITAPGLLWYLGGFYTVIQFSEPLLYISGCFLHVCNVGSEPNTCTDSDTELGDSFVQPSLICGIFCRVHPLASTAPFSQFLWVERWGSFRVLVSCAVAEFPAAAPVQTSKRKGDSPTLCAIGFLFLILLS